MAKSSLNEKILTLLKDIVDPEIPVNIVDLGLIYDISIQDKTLNLTMTLTNPGCPIASEFPQVVKSHLESLPEIEEVIVKIVWDPPWSPDRMTEAAKLKLGLL